MYAFCANVNFLKKEAEMKKICSGFIVIISIALMSGIAMGVDSSSAALGQKLFNDATLGNSANDKSCNSCHPGGQGLEKAGAKPKLAGIINKCVTGQLKGKKIDGRTVAMRSLKMYVKSFEKL